MTVRELDVESALVMSGAELQPRFDPEPIPRKELVRRVVALTGCSADSVLPSDFTYNLVNRAGVSCERPIFVREGRGRYRFVGRNHHYTGPIYWKPRGEHERQVGRWINGQPHFADDPRNS